MARALFLGEAVASGRRDFSSVAGALGRLSHLGARARVEAPHVVLRHGLDVFDHPVFVAPSGRADVEGRVALGVHGAVVAHSRDIRVAVAVGDAAQQRDPPHAREAMPHVEGQSIVGEIRACDVLFVIGQGLQAEEKVDIALQAPLEEARGEVRLARELRFRLAFGLPAGQMPREKRDRHADGEDDQGECLGAQDGLHAFFLGAPR